MIKQVVIAGCRDYNNYEEANQYIDFCLSNIGKQNEIIIISCLLICFWNGKSKGTRSMIELAIKYNKPLKIKNIYRK